MALISSRTNPKIKQIRALRGRKARQESGLFIIEGLRHIGEAFEAGIILESLVYAPDLLHSEFGLDLVRQASTRDVPVYETSSEVFDSISEKENPQGILAVAQMKASRLEDLHPKNCPWAVALVAPQDPGNVGTILRTLDAVGASALLLLDSSVDLYHPAAVRASMGALFWVPAATAGFDEFAEWAARFGYHVFGSSTRGQIDYRQIRVYPRPCVLLLGSEREGLSPEQAAQCEQLIRLPMQGRSTSLNLAVAAGVLLYAMLEGGLES